MSDNSFKKSPTAFLQNRLSLNRLIQNGSKKRIEKEIEYFKGDDTTANGPFTPIPTPAPAPDPYEGSDFHGNNQGLDLQVDGNSAVLAGNCPHYNPDRFKSEAKLRVATPGFRQTDGGVRGDFVDALIKAEARPQGALSSACGLAPYFVKTLKGETRQLDSATFLKVSCGTTPTIYAHINGTPATNKFLTCSNMYSGNDYLDWTDGTNHYYSETYDYWADDTLYSNTTLTTEAGSVVACFVDAPYPTGCPMLAGMFRSIELDETVGQTNYYGWFYFGNSSNTEFTQVYTTAEKPAENAPIFYRDIHTGTYVQFPADFKVTAWSAPATMFDVDFEYDYTPDISIDVPLVKNVAKESNDKIEIDPAVPLSTHYHYNLRALLGGYSFEYPVKQVTVKDNTGETPVTIGTFDFDSVYGDREYTKWKNHTEGATPEYVYGYRRSYVLSEAFYSDENHETFVGWADQESVVYDTTPEEKIAYMAYANPEGNYSQPYPFYSTMTPDYTSADRRSMLLDAQRGVDLTPYIVEKWWTTANLGYGEVSSQTTLYTETVFRYKDLDAHLKQYLPATWEGNAYGCVIIADTSARSGKFGGNIFLGVSHTDFFQDGSDVYYIIPTNPNTGGAGENGPYDLIHAYVYDAALNSIYSTNFAIDSTAGGVTVTHHYISDATKNYQVNGNWRYHYACIEDKNQDIWAKRLAYDFSDLYYLVDGEETPLNPDTQTLVTPQLFPYATIFEDYTNGQRAVCAWYDFAHTVLPQITSFGYSKTIEGESCAVHTERLLSYDQQKDSTQMYAWDAYAENHGWIGQVYTDTLNIVVNTTKVWTLVEGTWTEGETISSVTSENKTWYRFHTSTKETYVVDEIEHETAERFKVIWVDNREPYDVSTVVTSNYDANNPAVPTTPNLSSIISQNLLYRCYIAPAYQLVVTYKGEDFTYTADYALNNPYVDGILYSGWSNAEAPMTAFFTARITPRVGDKLYYIEADGTHVAEDFVIKEVKSVVDFIYPGRQ